MKEDAKCPTGALQIQIKAKHMEEKDETRYAFLHLQLYIKDAPTATLIFSIPLHYIRADEMNPLPLRYT